MVKSSGYASGWLIGFLEGEGSFYCRMGAPRSDHPTKLRNTIMLCAEQVQEWPLTEVQRLVGGGVRVRHRPPPRGTIYVWSIRGQAAADLMTEILPLMSPRRQGQIREAVRKWNGRPNQRAGRLLA